METRRAAAFIVVAAAAALLAGCLREDAPAAEADAPAWLPGDRWTFRLIHAGRGLVDEWRVLGPVERDGRAIVDVLSHTTGRGVDDAQTGSFDARTLALVRVEGVDGVVDFDPAEAWLFPAADRAYISVVTRSGPAGTSTERVEWTVRDAGVETVTTVAGTFAAHRFEVESVSEGGRGEATTWWWAPSVANVVLQERGGIRIREITAWSLADGPRAAPGG